MQWQGWRTAARSMLATAALATLALPAQAHLMPQGQGSVRLVGDSAYSAIAVPARALTGIDDNGDGLLSAAEIDAHRADISRQVAQLVRYDDGESAGKLLFEDFLMAQADEPAVVGSDYLVAAQRYQWPHAVTTVRLHTRLLEHAGSGQLLMRALFGPRSDVMVLTRERPDAQFFAGHWATLKNFAKLGTEHILLGPDHLVFLLTVLILGAGWRYWLGMVTSFTIAHSVTLTLSALGWVRLAPSIVEPLIAASIVLMALYNLVRGAGATVHRLALVFACGLLHGLGLASVLADLGLSSENRGVSLLGFNLGVEIGQLLFVSLMLLVLAAVQRGLNQQLYMRFLQACSALAAVAGIVWLLERTGLF